MEKFGNSGVNKSQIIKERIDNNKGFIEEILNIYKIWKSPLYVDVINNIIRLKKFINKGESMLDISTAANNLKVSLMVLKESGIDPINKFFLNIKLSDTGINIFDDEDNGGNNFAY